MLFVVVVAVIIVVSRCCTKTCSCVVSDAKTSSCNNQCCVEEMNKYELSRLFCTTFRIIIFEVSSLIKINDDETFKSILMYSLNVLT